MGKLVDLKFDDLKGDGRKEREKKSNLVIFGLENVVTGWYTFSIGKGNNFTAVIYVRDIPGADRGIKETLIASSDYGEKVSGSELFYTLKKGKTLGQLYFKNLYYDGYYYMDGKTEGGFYRHRGIVRQEFKIKWYPPQMIHIETMKEPDVMFVTTVTPLIQADKIEMSCKGYTNYRSQPLLKYGERQAGGFKVLAMQPLLRTRLYEKKAQTGGVFWGATNDDLKDVKTIYAGITHNKGAGDPRRGGSGMRVELNTEQEKHKENNISRGIAKIFNIASFDKNISNYGEGGKIDNGDKASFLLTTNWNRLPCVKNISFLSKEEATTLGLDVFISTTGEMVCDQISNQELLSGVYDPRTVLPVLKERGIKELPQDVTKGYMERGGEPRKEVNDS